MTIIAKIRILWGYALLHFRLQPLMSNVIIAISLLAVLCLLASGLGLSLVCCRPYMIACEGTPDLDLQPLGAFCSLSPSLHSHPGCEPRFKP